MTSQPPSDPPAARIVFAAEVDQALTTGFAVHPGLGRELDVAANRTCEMSLRHATGRPFESVLLLLEGATRGR